MKRQTPLTPQIEDGELVIRIGVETLASATEVHPHLYWRDPRSDGGPKFKGYIDADRLAADVCERMNETQSDGGSMLTDFFDDVVKRLILAGRLNHEQPNTNQGENHESSKMERTS